MKPCPCCGGQVSTIATQRSGEACPCSVEDMKPDGRCAVHSEYD